LGEERYKVRWKILLAIAIAAILISAALIVYYLESSPVSNSPWGNPSLIYDFKSTILFNGVDGYYYGGSFLGWNTNEYVFNNETDAVSVHLGGFLSRGFEAFNSTVGVSFDWMYDVKMVVSRQLNGAYSDLTYSNSTEGYQPNTNAINFDVDNSTTFTVRFEPNGLLSTYLYRVKLWNSIESS
jgi:hypothetical protein